MHSDPRPRILSRSHLEGRGTGAATRVDDRPIFIGPMSAVKGFRDFSQDPCFRRWVAAGAPAVAGGGGGAARRFAPREPGPRADTLGRLNHGPDRGILSRFRPLPGSEPSAPRTFDPLRPGGDGHDAARWEYMANSKSAAKRVRTAERNRQRNVAARTELRSQVKKFRQAVAAGDVAEATRLLTTAHSTIDRSAKKGVLKNGTADRYKSRLARAHAKLQAAGATS